MRFRIFAPALAFTLALACRQEAAAPAADPAAASTTVTTAAAPSDPPGAAPAKPARAREERPLPSISGWTLDDQRFDVANLLGQRLLLFFFNPEVKEASVVAQTIQAIAPLRGKHNFQIAGSGRSSRARAGLAGAAAGDSDGAAVATVAGAAAVSVGG